MSGVPIISQTLGHPKLKPEQTYSYYIGGVWNPGSSDPEHSWWGWANGFSAYFNWYQIDQHNLIGYLNSQEVVDLAAAGAPFPGTSVIRAPNGTVTEVIESYENLGNSRNNGIEFGVNYVSKEYNWGRVDFEFSASYLYIAHPPYSSDWYQGYDPGETNYIQRFFYVSVDKKF